MAATLAACAGEQATRAPAAAPAPVAIAAPGRLAAVAPKPANVPMAKFSAPKPDSANPLLDPNRILAKRSVFYDLGTYAERPELRRVLKAHATCLKQHHGASVMIEGNRDG